LLYAGHEYPSNPRACFSHGGSAPKHGKQTARREAAAAALTQDHTCDESRPLAPGQDREPYGTVTAALMAAN